MKIKCSFCGSPIEAMSEKCPHCGATNEKAAMYANQHEHNMRVKEQAREEAYASGMRVQAKAKKIIIAIYGTIAVLIGLPIIVGVILGISNNIDQKNQRAQKELQKQEQLLEEQRQQEEAEREQKEYEAAIVAVEGINAVAEKDRYYSIQVTEVVPYELNYDHNTKEWGPGMVDGPILRDDEHRIAIHIKVKNYMDKVSIYGKPNGFMKLYIEDENSDSIVIQEDSFLNGNRDDNYYSGGMMISENEFSDNYGKSLESNQTMSWWVPIVVNEKSEKVILNFDHNMSITVDNPYAGN